MPYLADPFLYTLEQATGKIIPSSSSSMTTNFIRSSSSITPMTRLAVFVFSFKSIDPHQPRPAFVLGQGVGEGVFGRVVELAVIHHAASLIDGAGRYSIFPFGPCMMRTG